MGCLTSLVAPIVALVVYPKANWLFAVPLVGIALLVLAFRMKADPAATEVADWAERLLEGNSRGWDVDDYEHLHPNNQPLKDLWLRTMALGAPPEEWAKVG